MMMKGCVYISLNLFVFLYSISSLSNIAVSQDPRSSECFSREDESHLSIVDSHVHFKSFGGDSLPFSTVVKYLESSNIKYANVFGLGFSENRDPICIDYIECAGEHVLSSVMVDLDHVKKALLHANPSLNLVVAISFPDFSKPDNILEVMRLYERDHPHVFRWMGEINLVNKIYSDVDYGDDYSLNFREVTPVMDMLRERNIPITIHSDLGVDKHPFKFKYIMDSVLKRYPNNKIVWAHMGVANFIADMNPFEHVAILSQMLNEYPNLMLDTSSEFLWRNYILRPFYQNLYIDFFNRYSTRILPGTDFVAAEGYIASDYKEALQLASSLNPYFDDDAFRNIALGENYFRLLGLTESAPSICESERSKSLKRRFFH